MPPVYIGLDKLSELPIGTAGVSKIYIGTDLYFQKGRPTPPPEFPIHIVQNGSDWMGNTAWNYRNLAGVVSYQSTPLLHSYSGNSGSSRFLMLIPAGATKLCVNARRGTYAIQGFGFGLVPSNVDVNNILVNSNVIVTNDGAIPSSYLQNIPTSLTQYEVPLSGYSTSIEYKFYCITYKMGNSYRFDFYAPEMWIE